MGLRGKVAWIKFDKDLVNDPRVLRAAGALAEKFTISRETSKGDGFAVGSDLTESESIAVMRNAVIGALVTLWVYADTHITEGDILKISQPEIDHLVGIDGFCWSVGPEWIEETNNGVWTVLPGYCEKNGLLSKEKRRSENAARQRRYRQKHNGASNARSNGVSNGDVTRLDQDQDQDIKKKSTVRQKPDALAVLQFLNEKTGRNYEPLPATLEPIIARLKEGATVDDMRAVVAKKCREWSADERMEKYLRPKTLFNRTNFANYKGELEAT